MPKITIEEKDYNTEDFNEEQTKVYNEIVFVSGEMDRLAYTYRTLDARRNMLANLIVAEEVPAEVEASDG